MTSVAVCARTGCLETAPEGRRYCSRYCSARVADEARRERRKAAGLSTSRRPRSSSARSARRYDRAEIVRIYKEALRPDGRPVGIADVARRIGCHCRTVAAHLRAAGVKVRRSALYRFRPGMRVGEWTLVRRTGVSAGWRAICSCGTPATTNPSQVGTRGRNDRCSACSYAARRLPRLCRHCGETRPEKFGPLAGRCRACDRRRHRNGSCPASSPYMGECGAPLYDGGRECRACGWVGQKPAKKKAKGR